MMSANLVIHNVPQT